MDSITASMDGAGECKCFKSTGHNEHREQLFPRLPNEITFSRIVPKLPWTAFHILAAVSRNWRKAIRDHRVHDARMHSSSTNMLVVHGHNYDFRDYMLNGAIRSARIAVYSARDKLCYDLPPVPGYTRGVPCNCECVSLDGRIYVLGGADDHDRPWDRVAKVYPATSKVYVLDLAGASHWMECASMERGRKDFGCAILQGKIYVFGGSNNDGPVRGAEVYDPKVNVWSPIAPMPDLRYEHKVSTLAEEIFVYGGWFYHPSYLHWKANGGSDSTLERSLHSFTHSAKYANVYDPVKDEWRVDYNSVRNLNIEFLGSRLFAAQGKLHAIRANDAISVHENDGSWTHLTETEFPDTGMDEMAMQKIVEVESSNELLAGVYWTHESDQEGVNGLLAICQSKGFGTENNTVVWNVISRCPGYFKFMHCIQL